MTAFRNDDSVLRRRVERIDAERRGLGLEGLVGGLEAMVFNVEPGLLKAAAAEFLATTGHYFGASLEGHGAEGCVLELPGSADLFLRARKSGPSPFDAEPLGPKSAHLPRTRVETLVFLCHDVERYAALQKSRGVRFLSPEPIRSRASVFIQTEPSAHSALSYGFVQWLQGGRQYADEFVREAGWALPKPDRAHLRRIGALDHASVRVHARDRDEAIAEFVSLTDYRYAMSVHVESLNSITNVARLPGDPYAMVITSGLGDTVDGEPGPTEKFIANYGRRIHHLAFNTTGIQEAFAGLKASGMEFLLELVGSPEEGLRQTFSRPLPSTLMVNEYIERYEGFDGFFTKSNVTRLTRATENQ